MVGVHRIDNDEVYAAAGKLVGYGFPALRCSRRRHNIDSASQPKAMQGHSAISVSMCLQDTRTITGEDVAPPANGFLFGPSPVLPTSLHFPSQRQHRSKRR